MTNKSTLVKVFGETPYIKIMDTFLDHPIEYTQGQLADVNDIAKSTVSRKIDKLKEINMIKETRKAGNAQMYKLNKDSKVAEAILELEDKLREDNGNK